MADRIERTILVHAPLDRVWDLVTEPGWWVPTDSPVPLDRAPGAVTVRESQKWGRFPVQVVELQPKSYAAFRWASQAPGHDLTGDNTTLVEFTVVPEPEGIRVTVVESGFDAIAMDDAARAEAVRGNESGWTEEMDSLRGRAEESAA